MAYRQDVHKAVLQKAGYRDLEDWLSTSSHVYIGRGMTFYVPVAVKHEFANPFSVKKYGRTECLRLYRTWLLEKLKDPASQARFMLLKDRALGCWCKADEACHADVVNDLLQEQGRGMLA